MKTIALVVLAGCSWIGGGVAGSGKATSEVRTVGNFQAIEVGGALGVDVAMAAEPRVEISGDDNLVPLVTTEVKSGKLEIGTRKNMRPSVPLVARVAVPQISGLEVSGSSVVTLHELRGDRLSLEVTGSATVRGDGTVQQLDIEVSGSGGLTLDRLNAERATVTISGSGSVTVAASKSLDVHISGSGLVTYTGNPEVKQDISGSGRLVKR
jgi:hypothetical protein